VAGNTVWHVSLCSGVAITMRIAISVYFTSLGYTFYSLQQDCVDPSQITALKWPARCCALARAADMDRKAAAIDGTDRRPAGRYRPCTAYYAGSVNRN